MKHYIIYYKDGSTKKAEAKSDLELVKKYDLASRENAGCRIMEIASA